ncbi:MAG: flavocytochrome c [Turicibacter sp.]|nr:flavocytochrome c [Turicibacter sp.]
MKKFTKIAALFVMMLALFVFVACDNDNGNEEAGASTYEGVGEGFGGNVYATVTIEDGIIIDIEVDVANETEGFRELAADQIPDLVIEHQSIEVDAVTGATETSDGIIEAITAALVAAGLNLDDFRGDVAVEGADVEDLEADIVIVGAGGAGLAAAIEAAEAGASVIILERMPIVGGNTLRATGGMNASETELQAALDIEDDVDSFFEDTLTGGQGTNDQELLRIMVDYSADAVHWINDLGAGLDNVTPFGGQTVNRTHRPVDGSPAGPIMVEVLTDRAEALGVDILLNSEVTAILTEGDTVIGVLVEDVATGDEFTVTAAATILASGGFGANPEMIEYYDPDLAGYFTTNHSGADGLVIQMAADLGADLVDMVEIQTHPTTDRETGYMFTEAFRSDGAIIVNNEGVRFVHELETRDVVAAAILAQPDTDAFLITNGDMRENNATLDRVINAGFAVYGETLEELAEALGIDAEAFVATMEAYREMVASDEDTDFGREVMSQDFAEGPFYALSITPSIHHTMGGVRIDAQTRVLNAAGEAIPGLYAAGEIVGGIHGANRLGGNALTDIIVFGRIAGQIAASELD